MTSLPMPSAPTVHLERVSYPEYIGFNARISAYQVVGTDNIKHAIDMFASYASTTGAVRDVAMDIETHGTDATTWWEVTCLTAAFHTGVGIISVLFDPLRNPEHRKLIRRLVELSSRLVFHNCFAGDTKVITREGLRRLEDLAGSTVDVWAEGSWHSAPVRMFGESPVQRVEVAPARYRSNVRHHFDATPNHRWPLVDGRVVTTDALRPGDRILASRVEPSIDHSSDAFKHGLIFADGALCTHQPIADGVWGYQLRLCGAKSTWVHLFDNVTYPPSAGGDPVVTGKLPFNPKELPANADAEYVANFIEGWQLLDGGDFGANRAVTTVKESHAEWLLDHAALGGWFATGRSSVQTTGYSLGTTVYNVVLSKGNPVKPVEWRVTSVGDPSAPVPVYCATVEGVERFTLAEGVYTANCSFDLPPLIAHRILELDDINKVWDTLVLARMLNTSARAGRTLEDLSTRYRLLPDDGISISKVFSAGGHKTIQAGFSESDIDGGTYRDGAMSDTVVTLQLLPVLERAVERRHDASTQSRGAVFASAEGARDLIRRMQRVNQICARRAARGYRFDPEFPEKFDAGTREAYREACEFLANQGLEPGRGDKLIERLHGLGQLPDNWPRTKTGQLSADKKAMEKLKALGENDILAKMHLIVAETTKVAKYLDKVVEQGRATGRVHPGIGILAASASGRMSVNNPELHQFPGNARGIILADEEPGWTSVDWSSIEPVLMAVCAGDNDFINPFYEGQDLYVPVARAAGLIPATVSNKDAKDHKGRKVAKVILLAGMYGQGISSLSDGLSAALKEPVSRDTAAGLSRTIKDAMPVTFDFMDTLQAVAEGNNSVTTIAGRVLDEDAGYTYRAVNHFCQGSAADVLYDATLRADAEGLTDHIHLWMHDELVVDTSVQGEINRIMQTPPEVLRAWARTERVELQTDANPLGMEWKSV